MLKIALKNNPTFVCLVPEKRKEITTEGGLNLIKYLVLDLVILTFVKLYQFEKIKKTLTSK